MIVMIQGHSYQMTRKEFNGFVKTLKKSLEKKPMILALEKNGVVEMRKDIFQSQQDLTRMIKSWNSKGFKVSYMRGF